MARKYALIFVRGYYLFREANSFPREKIEENCELRGTENGKDKRPRIFLNSNGGYCVYHPSNIFRNTRHLFTNSLPSKMFFGVLWYQQVYFFFCHKGKAFSHLDINFNCKLEGLKVLEMWEFYLGNMTRIYPRYGGIFGHVMCLDQSRVSKNI